MDGFTTYALVAAGAFVVFFIAVSLFLRRRSRILKAYRLANERSILPVAQNPVPGATVPFDSVTPGPNTPGSGNVGFLSNSSPISGGDTMSIKPLPSFNQKTQQPNRSQSPPAYKEV